MSKEALEIVFRTLLSEAEYQHLAKIYEDKPNNVQINYYFDTSRYTLKASEISLKVRLRENYEISLSRKKGYNNIEINTMITKEQLTEFQTSGVIPSPEIQSELNDILKGQTLVNYMSFETERIYFSYGHGNIAIDKCNYLGQTDYEIEFQAPNNESCKVDFVSFVKGHNLIYKRCEPKLKRAYNVLRHL